MKLCDGLRSVVKAMAATMKNGGVIFFQGNEKIV
jgi:hypothetical protein